MYFVSSFFFFDRFKCGFVFYNFKQMMKSKDKILSTVLATLLAVIQFTPQITSANSICSLIYFRKLRGLSSHNIHMPLFPDTVSVQENLECI